MEDKLHGLDLFSGIGGLTTALAEWVKPVAYCERDRYAQGVLLSRMSDGTIPTAPIWDDVSTLDSSMLPRIDLIYGGFPCQDISVAGNGVGLGGERSGLFYEIVHLAQEIQPPFIFLENVPAIRTRGLDRVIQELTEAGYDCRWTMLSARDVGANHKRERWFLLAHAVGADRRDRTDDGRCDDQRREAAATEPEGIQPEVGQAHPGNSEPSGEVMANSSGTVVAGNRTESDREQGRLTDQSWWTVEPNVGRVAHGVPNRVDRLKCLGNAVVPLQAKTAFEILLYGKG